MPRLLTMLIFMSLVVSAIGAGDQDRDAPHRLDATIARVLEEHPLPGAAAVVLEGDEIVAAGCAGVRKRGADAAITLEDRWHLGSCTKAMTATVVAVLIEEGRLDREITLAEAFEDFADAIDPKFRDATLERLLSHRAGLPTKAPELWPAIFRNRSEDPVKDRRRMVRLILGRDHGPAVGRYEYSNFGYAIAGHLAETVTGTPWERLMRETLFDPLGMDSAGFGVPWDDPAVTDPWGHRANGKSVAPGRLADNPPAIAPAGTVHATIGDWARFIAAHLAGAQGEQSSLDLPADAFEDLHESRGPMHEGGSDGYALGWVTTTRPWAEGPHDDDIGRVLTHAGSNTMFFSVVWMAPERGFAVLACTNQGGDGAAGHLDAIVSTILRAYLAGTFD